ncbi:MAG TPA: thioredoxin family protein [Nitrosospira sp.]|jgi:thioredoxin 1|nr:thioredoxin family protein [Nitrosospira sp.]
MDSIYPGSEPARAEIDALEGLAMLEFGAQWCGYCRAAQRSIAEAMAGHPEVRHVRIEDGKGRALGRSFGVKLWPTLIFLRQGKEIARVVRPADSVPIRQALEAVGAP